MAADETPTNVPCSACRGTGRLISNLGGSPSEVVCPWCEGRGQRLSPEHDAQAFSRGGGGPPDEAA
ncbi:MAG TPA: hypothetical protein VIL49_15225 [Capillimicrobium sp.]|jgi:DnaJ-class molecular chaperone